MHFFQSHILSKFVRALRAEISGSSQPPNKHTQAPSNDRHRCKPPPHYHPSQYRCLPSAPVNNNNEPPQAIRGAHLELGGTSVPASGVNRGTSCCGWDHVPVTTCDSKRTTYSVDLDKDCLQSRFCGYQMVQCNQGVKHGLSRWLSDPVSEIRLMIWFGSILSSGVARR